MTLAEPTPTANRPDADLLAGPTGRLVRPSNEYWDVARAAWVVNVEQCPAVVAEVNSAEDVRAVVRSAAGRGLTSSRRAPGTPPRWCRE
jgi:hypothetical protein